MEPYDRNSFPKEIASVADENYPASERSLAAAEQAGKGYNVLDIY